jgi:hypothetical protein
MARPLEPVDRADTAPGVSLAVGRLLPPRAGTVHGRLRRVLARLDAAAAEPPPRDIARAKALLAALLPRQAP